MLLTAMNISSSRNLFFILSLILDNKNGKFLTIFLKLLNYSVKHFTPAKLVTKISIEKEKNFSKTSKCSSK